MKFLVLVCALAVASADYIAPVEQHFVKPEHYPVIGANGVPIDTPAVQQAKATHFMHKAEAHMRNGDYVQHPIVSYPHTPIVPNTYHNYEHHTVAVPSTYHNYEHHPVAVPTYPHATYPHVTYPVNGAHVPTETPEVVAAKLNHFAAHYDALHRHRRDVHMPYSYFGMMNSYSAYPYNYNYPNYYYKY